MYFSCIMIVKLLSISESNFYLYDFFRYEFLADYLITVSLWYLYNLNIQLFRFVKICHTDSIFVSLKQGWSFAWNNCTECYLYIEIRCGRLIDIIFSRKYELCEAWIIFKASIKLIVVKDKQILYKLYNH